MAKDHILLTIVWLYCMLGLLPSFGLALWLNLSPSQMKCVSEEIRTNLIALGDYTVITEDEATIVPTISANVFCFQTKFPFFAVPNHHHHLLKF